MLRYVTSRSALKFGLSGLLGLLLAGTALAQGGSGKLNIQTMDAARSKPLPGVKVKATPGGKSCRTGGDGRCTIAGLADGRYTVIARRAGYQTQRRSVAISGGMSLNLALSMKLMQPKPSVVPKVAVKEAEVRGHPRPKPSRRRAKGKMSYLMSPSPVSTTTQGGGTVRSDDRRPGPVHNTEQYDRIYENPFKAALKEPLSTFSIDVDTASYSNSRRFISQNHRLPPKDAVRVEEWINYFRYDYPNPRGKHPFSITTELSQCPWNKGHRLMMIGMQGMKVDAGQLPPMNLVFLMDVSGSMSSPNKLPLLKRSFHLLVDEMRPQDKVSMVVYAGAAGMVLPPTSGKKKGAIMAALERLSSGGSTAGGAGIKLAYQVAGDNFIKGGNNRIILATDGDFNVGQSSDSELVRLIEQKRKRGIFLTVLGFGMGNYKDSKMEKLADKGNGNYAYIDSILEAKKVLVTEMGATLLTIAKDVKIQVEFNPAKVKAYRLIGYENRMLRAQDFNDDKKDAGELGSGHNVTAIYEIIPAGSKEKVPGVDELKYQKTSISDAARASGELATVKLRYKPPRKSKSILLKRPLKDSTGHWSTASINLRWATAVAEAALLLRGSKHKGTASWESLLGRAREAQGKDPYGYRAEFIQLMKAAEQLAKTGR